IVLGEILPGEEGWSDLRVDVRDTGIGISADQAARLFRPFVQGDPSTTRKYGGTGLGLVISKRLAEGMGGSISIEKTDHQGAHFRFRLPLKILAGKPRDKDSPGRTVIGFPPGYSVLVVEDNETSRLVAVSLLEKIGVPKIETAEDGAVAIEKLSSKRYDLVLMDIQMPVMDGMEAVAAIRDSTSPVLDHQVPVAAMTANILPADREKYLRSGMTDYISKPVLSDDLARLILKSLGAETARNLNRESGDDMIIFRKDILLSRMGGDEKLCEKTLQLFVDDSLKLARDLAAFLESGDLDRLEPVRIALLEDHDADAVDGVGEGVLVADDGRAGLGPLDDVRIVRILARAVVLEDEAVGVVLLAVVGVVHAAKSRNHLIEREVGPLHLVHVLGRDEPALRDGAEREDREYRDDADEHHREQQLDHGEGAARHSLFLQKVT
ncbi:MAG: response regulator, partial [Synergistales bacterium]|nr:response regulator [Synergistales bacterium]